MDQTAINKIIMDAEAEDPNKKLEKLEKEVQVLKGSIKKLILDIREEMNNADNPFLNIQQLQAPVPAPLPAEMINDGLNEIAMEEPNKEPKKEYPKKSAERIPDPEIKIIEEQKKELEEEKRMLEDMRIRSMAAQQYSACSPRKLDPYTMTQLMEWTRSMLRKNGQERFNDMLEMYVLTGYINEDMKGVINKVAKLMESEPQKVSKKLDIQECVRDLYTLYIILNPKDKEFDSRMLSVLLNSENKF
jgi:hypothetical protein